MSGIKFSGFLATPSDGDLGASPLSGKGPNDRAILSEESPNTSPDGSSEETSLPIGGRPLPSERDHDRSSSDSPNGEAPDTSSLSVDKETPPSIKGGPTLKAGRRVILTTVNKSNSANKVLSMEVENPLVNKPGDLISLNISLNKGIRSRGRPKKSAAAMNETNETRDRPKRSADAMNETNEISHEKKVRKKGDKASEKASDKKIETQKQCRNRKHPCRQTY